jgi:hypothetical protein
MARAQQTLGSLNGTVLDASGAAVPGSSVTATDDAIGVTRTTKAQGNGYFQIFNLPVGTYTVKATHDGFDTTALTGIEVQEAGAKTVNFTLKVGEIAISETVTANPLLNATDATNGYTLDQAQIALTPLATGSFTQLAVLSPGVNAELLSGIGTNAGLGNQPIWANGQRDTSNTFQVNGVDSTNLFNGKSSSSDTSQRYNFNIGEGQTVGGAVEEGSSVYGSNGNSLPAPPPEFIQELRVNTSMYDAQQGATSGAQIDVNTMSGTNHLHGQIYGSFANSSLNTAPFFFNQDYALAQEGVGAFPESLRNPLLHRWTTGATLGGPVIKNKLFFFVAYQHLYDSDNATGLTQFNVPQAFNTTNCPNGRDSACLEAVAEAYGKTTSPITLDPSGVAQAMFNATLPNGQYLIPYAQTSGSYAYDVPNVTLVGTSLFKGDQAAASVDYDVTATDRLSFKYYYQNDPETAPYGFFSKVGGFPSNTTNEAQVGALDNTISIGPRLNWEQRLGYVRMGTYSTYHQTINNAASGVNAGPSFGITNSAPGGPAVLPSFDISEFAVKTSDTPGLDLGPNSTFVNTGYYQNRLNPSTNVIFTAGNHTLVAGGGYSYTQLNVENNRNGLITEDVSNLTSLLEGDVHKSNTLETLAADGKNLADRYYRTNEGAGYVQDKWQALPNLSITAGARWDYHGGMTEKYGNFFNFDPNAYNVTGTDPAVGGTGFTVVNDGLVVAGNNPTAPTSGTSASTLTGRQWGISPRVGFAYSPKRFNNKIVINGGAGIYYDRGELFTYLSPPAGGSVGGPFGVTQEAPLVSAVSGNGKSISNPLGTAGTLTSTSTPPQPSVNPAVEKTALQNQLNSMTGSTEDFGLNCGGVGNLEDECTTTPLYIGAYDKDNVLPYTINYTLNVQWQPRNDLAVTIGYSGNRGRHAVIPIPFNEPQLATPSNPAMILGASPHSSGEANSYGYEVLNGNTSCGYYDDPCPIASEPWDTYDGGNSDFRAPYVGYSPYAALFKTVGNSAYDSLTAHVEKRLSQHFRASASYTWSHALDEQSDIGLFFTGNNPDNLKQSYASSDFDRKQVFSANFQVLIPNAAPEHSALAYLTNDWSVTGITILQSGEPYSLYEYNGAVASAQLGYYPSLINPVLPIADPSNPKSALTGNPGRFRGVGGSYIPAIDPNQVAIQYLAPGQNGVPTAAQGAETDPVDVYETNFGTGDQRNIFRQSAQRSLDLSFRKQFHVKGRINLQYAFDIYNVTNTTSMDVPQDSADIGQHGSCANGYLTGATSLYDCTENYEVYGEVITSQADQGTTGTGPTGGGTAGSNLFQKPYTNGTSGKGTMVPLTLPIGVNGCSTATEVTSTGCANNNANLGSVTGVIGSQRLLTMELHITF